MPRDIGVTWPEGATRGLSLTLEDTDGAVVDDSAIVSVTYTWTDKKGDALNGREDTAATAENPVIIKFTPTDLGVTETEKYVERLLTVTWVYDDTNLGASAKEVVEFKIRVENLTNKGSN